MPRPWSVLILALGHGREHLHDIAKDACVELGFETNIYSQPGYPVDPKLFSHANCVKVIEQHDIVIAFVDLGEGGTFQVKKAPPAMVKELRRLRVLPPQKSTALIPTILEVEIMAARARGKTTLLFMPKSVERTVYDTKKKIRNGVLRVKRRRSHALSLNAVFRRDDWARRLAEDYTLVGAHSPTLRQLALIERLREETPNWVSYFRLSNRNNLRAHLRSRLKDVIQHITGPTKRFVEEQLQRKRPLGGTNSLRDILDAGLIVQPPFRVESGQPAGSRELVSFASTRHGFLAENLLRGESTLVVGPPGVGKTTISLLALKDLLSDVALESRSFAPLYCQGRDLTTGVAKPGHLYRFRFGAMSDRDSWPAKLSLPNLNWLLVLDGIDESPLDPGGLYEMLRGLPPPVTFLLTCRDVDFERRLSKFREFAPTIVRLDLWQRSHVEDYIDRLRRAGRKDAADFVAERCKTGDVATDVISIPLWLTMLTYIAEQPGIKGHPQIARDLTSDYALLQQCFDAVCEEEVSRRGLGNAAARTLKTSWAETAFQLHVARRNRERVPVAQLATAVKQHENSPLFAAVCSVLEIEPGGVAGFTHEVFREFWLAQYLVNHLSDETADPVEVARLFSYQRSLVTNHLLRARIAMERTGRRISDLLRRAYFEAESLQERRDFARNQLVYLTGRIDDGPATRAFLRDMWGNERGSAVVRHSAAFAAIIQGNMEIERQYYDLLRGSKNHDRINRGYHLYYYEDQDIPEDRMPPVDDESAPARYALEHLFRRLGRSGESNLNLRRIELFTIRKFLETRRSLPITERHALSIVRRVGREIQRARVSREFANSVQSEVSRLMRRISRRPKIGLYVRRSSGRRR